MRSWARPVAVGLVSAATLVYEVLLVRIFAIAYFHHFAYMAIGVAMLGFGVSGTAYALWGRPDRLRNARWLGWAAALTPFALVIVPAVTTRLPIDPTQLPVDPRQWPLMAAAYLLLALPFVTGAFVVLLVLALETDRIGLAYGASFLGSGLGAALSVVLLWAFPPREALMSAAVIAALGAIPVARFTDGRITPILAPLGLVLAAAATIHPPWQLRVSAYKGLPQAEAFPDARRVAESSSPLGWVVAVRAPAFRYAPGLSLAYQGMVPDQTSLFVDGELVGAVAPADAEANPLLDWLPSALPYAAGTPHRVLVLGAGGSLEIAGALAHGATHVTGVELLPEIARLSGPASDPRVTWAIAEARTFASRDSGSYDLVTIRAEGGPGGSAAGVHALNEDFLHTVEAYRSDLALLGEGGILAVTRWLSVPPREPVRVILTAAEALRREGYSVERALVVAHSWATVTVLARPAGFTPTQIQSIRTWAERRQFDLDWYPGLSAPVMRYHRLGEPVLFLAAHDAAAGAESAAQFARRYPFDVSPADDAQPYPHHFLRLASLPRFLAGARGNWLPFAEWGVLALVATLAQSVLLAAPLLAIPAVRLVRSRSERGLTRVAVYFGALGFAYLAAEVAVIQQLSLLLGHPVYAVAFVLAVLLVGSGVGSAWSDRRDTSETRMAPPLLLGLLVLLAGALLPLVHLTQPASLPARALVALASLIPLAFLMGIPFATGLRRLAGEDAGRIAWAWAVNGFASVVAAPVAALIALEQGSRVLLLAAAAAYGVAALAVRGRTSATVGERGCGRRRAPPGPRWRALISANRWAGTAPP